jgi:hypothetical protein
MASAPIARAFAKSEETLRPPVITSEISFMFLSSRNFLALCRANSVGIEVACLTNFFAAAVAPSLSLLLFYGF